MNDVVEILKDPATRAQYAKLSPEYRAAFEWRTQWLLKAHTYQITPSGDWWDIWLLLAGRGAGKTRTAAEQLGWWAWQNPNTRWVVAAPTSSDVRSTCFEGDSGLLSVIPPILIKDYNKALHELTLVNGSLIKGIPASEPERFRGPQFHGGWCCSPDTMIALPNGGERKIQDIRVGDVVMTRHGPRKVIAAGISGNPNSRVRIEVGDTSLTVTEDHPILIGDQWIPAGEIKKGDLLWRATNTLATDTRTALFTSGILARFPKAGSFITAMKTRATTTLQTLNRCLGQSIKRYTQQDEMVQRFRWLLPSALLNRSEAQRWGSASNVLLSSFPLLPIKWASFVLSPAANTGGTTSSSLNCGVAMFADQNTQRQSGFSDIAAGGATVSPKFVPIELRPMAVRSVERLPNSLTYNLTVEGEHEFIANGIVVHNCDELAAWEYLQDAWDMMQFGLRLGKKVRLICTTTPKPKDLILDLVDRQGDDVALVTASTYENLDNLADNFRKQILQYEGTKLGRQEIYAELIDPEEGGMVKREHFRLWPVNKPFPKFEYIIQSYDCAYTEKTVNDPTAATTWGVFKPQDGPMSVMLIDAWQDRLQYPDLRPKVIEEFKVSFGADPEDEERGNYSGGKKVDLVLIEDKAAGISLIQDLQRAHLPVRAYNPGRADKIQRLSIVANIISHKRVWIPESSTRKGYVRDWAEGFVSQICSFPESTHDDFVDSCTQALRYLRDAGFLDIDPRLEEDQEVEYYGRKKGNPYAI
jgi:predicted phage terminase large subunit-like protein